MTKRPTHEEVKTAISDAIVNLTASDDESAQFCTDAIFYCAELLAMRASVEAGRVVHPWEVLRGIARIAATKNWGRG